MAKQSIIARFINLFRASANDALDQLEDPEKILNQQMRDFAANVEKAQSAVASTIGNLRMMEKDQETQLAEYQTITEKATSAMARSQKATKDGDLKTAGEMKALAHTLLSKQVDIETEIKSRNVDIINQTGNADKMKASLVTLKAEQVKVERRKNDLITRSRMAESTKSVNEAMGLANGSSPLTSMGRIEAKIRKQEAEAMGHQELAFDTAVGQMGVLDSLDASDEVERRMAALVSGEGIASPLSITKE